MGSRGASGTDKISSANWTKALKAYQEADAVTIRARGTATEAEQKARNSALDAFRAIDKDLSLKTGRKYGFTNWQEGMSETGETYAIMPDGTKVYVGSKPGRGLIQVEQMKGAQNPLLTKRFTNYNDAYKFASTLGR